MAKRRAKRKTAITFDVVRDLGLKLPGVVVGTTYGSPALKVGEKMFVCIAVHKSAEPGTLAVRMDIDERDELIAADPHTYYLTDHYVDYPIVLVRLDRVSRDALADLVKGAHTWISRKRR